MKKVIALLIVATFAMPAVADFYVTGDFTTPQWNANDGVLMTETAPGSGIFGLDVTGLNPGVRHQFKIIEDNAGWDASLYHSNYWVLADASGEATITLNANTVADGWSPDTYRIGTSTDPGTWSAVGNFNGWNNNDPALAMADMGGGIYMTEVTGLAPGTYEGKSTVSGTWDAIGDTRSVNAANLQFTIDATVTSVEFWVDANAGTMKIVNVPEPATLALLAMGGLVIIRRR